MFLNILISFFFYFCFSHYIKINVINSIKLINSINGLINSGCIVISTSLYLTNYISDITQLNILYFSIGFYINDLLLNYLYYNSKQIIVKSIHHFISLMGILSFNNYKIEIAKLFQTEISNIPFEIRNILQYKNYPIFKTICIFCFYFSFLYLRIINGYSIVIKVCEKSLLSDCLLVYCIYILWWYLFILINYKIIIRLFIK